MARHSPEEERESCHASRDEDGDPDRAAKKKFLHVWLTDSEGTEWRRLGLAEEDKEGI